MQGVNTFLLQNLNQILASGMGAPLAGMLGQFTQLPQWNQAKPGMWQVDKVCEQALWGQYIHLSKSVGTDFGYIKI